MIKKTIQNMITVTTAATVTIILTTITRIAVVEKKTKLIQSSSENDFPSNLLDLQKINIC